MNETIVILSSRTLFVEGLVRRLRQTFCSGDVLVVDPSSETAFDEISVTSPKTILLDSTDLNATRFCHQYNLLNQFPSLRLVQIDPERERLHVLTSESHQAHRVQDLLDIIFRPYFA